MAYEKDEVNYDIFSYIEIDTVVDENLNYKEKEKPAFFMGDFEQLPPTVAGLTKQEILDHSMYNKNGHYFLVGLGSIIDRPISIDGKNFLVSLFQRCDAFINEVRKHPIKPLYEGRIDAVSSSGEFPKKYSDTIVGAIKYHELYTYMLVTKA